MLRRALFVDADRLHAPRPTQIDPPFGAPDEADQVVHLRAAQRGIRLDATQRLGGVELRLQQIPVGALQLRDGVWGAVATNQPHGVERECNEANNDLTKDVSPGDPTAEERFREVVTRLNKLIDDYNLEVPSDVFFREKIKIDEELARVIDTQHE